MTYDDFKNSLENARTEEVVKSIYAKFFNLKYDTSHHHDPYTPQVFFEFKADKNFHNLKAIATILAQTLYYIKRLKYFEIEKVIPFLYV